MLLMKKKYPNNLLLITYENLVRDPKIIFRKVLNFLGHAVTLSGNYEKFEKALNMSSKENIIKLENAYGRSIPGHYKDEFNDEEVKLAQDIVMPEASKSIRDNYVKKSEHDNDSVKNIKEESEIEKDECNDEETKQVQDIVMPEVSKSIIDHYVKKSEHDNDSVENIKEE